MKEESAEKSVVVVRELYPEEKSGFWRTRKCPHVDFVRENVYALEASGAVRPLHDEKDVNGAVKTGDRLFAAAKRQIPFSCLVPAVCAEAGYSWNYALEGTLEVADAAQFILGWARSEASCGIEGVTASALVSQVASDLGVLVRDQIAKVQRDGQYTIREIEEKDVLPIAFWNDLFYSEGKALLKGLSLKVASRQFLCPSYQVEEKRQSAQRAEAEMKERRRQEFEAAKDGKLADAELEELARRRELAQLQFELERTKLEEAVKRQKIDTAVYQMKQLNEAKAKFRNDVPENVSREVAQRIAELEAQMRELGVSPQGTQNWKSSEAIDPTVMPRFQGMSDAFRETLSKVTAHAQDALTLSWEFVRENEAGATTRDIVPACRRAQSAAKREVLHIGDNLAFRIRSARPGYLTLFNFGTSGKMSKLFPNPEYGTSNNRIEAERIYALPGELLPPEAIGGSWCEDGPVTAETGNPERILAILTDEPVALDESSLGFEVRQTLTRGGFDAVEEAVASIFDLAPGTWCFGLVEAVVE